MRKVSGVDDWSDSHILLLNESIYISDVTKTKPFQKLLEKRMLRFAKRAIQTAPVSAARPLAGTTYASAALPSPTQITRLPNGFTVASETIPGAETATVVYPPLHNRNSLILHFIRVYFWMLAPALRRQKPTALLTFASTCSSRAPRLTPSWPWKRESKILYVFASEAFANL